mmetsp:Transcript_12589/g.26486  ORF Transcript_12589/g.26486 Transcript_12589/m.26486 type:complete len:105 (-) Transcript_12589:235-549(-)
MRKLATAATTTHKRSLAVKTPMTLWMRSSLMQYAAKPTTTLVVATGGEGGKGLSPSNKYGRAAGKKISNSCNNNQHTLYSRQNIYSSSQSLREGQEENLQVALN